MNNLSEKVLGIKGMTDRLNALTADAEALMTVILDHVANGGSIVELAKLWDVRFAGLNNWIYADEGRAEKYNKAISTGNEWVVATIIDELKALGTADIRKLYGDNGKLLEPHEWPDDIAKAVAGMDVAEHKVDKDGNEIEPEVKKIKLYDKLKSIELMGKKLNIFTDRVAIEGRVTLEDMVSGANRGIIGGKKDAEKTQAEAGTEAAA